MCACVCVGENENGGNKRENAICFSIGRWWPSFSRKLSSADLLKADSNES